MLGRGLSEEVTSELRDKEPAVPTSVQCECPRAERALLHTVIQGLPADHSPAFSDAALPVCPHPATGRRETEQGGLLFF